MSLPSGYAQLEYIQSSGTQYIDTGFKPNQNTRFVADVEIVSVQNAQLFGARIASANSAFNMLVSSKTGGRDDYGTTVLNFTTTSERWKIDKNKNITTVNDVSVSHGVETFQTTCSIFINAVNNNGTPMSTTTASAKWRTVQIYNNGVLSRNFIPCKNPSGVVGLYDLVNNQFYQNAGTGSFVAGAEVKGSHKTLIDGTWYDLKAGKCLVGGTAYSVKNGRVLVNSTGYNIPFSSGIPLSTITPGAILYLNESGSPVPFYIAKHDYESGLNGAGRTLVVRKDCYDMRAFDSNSINAYANSSLDSWLHNTYLKLLDADIQTAIGTTKFYYTRGNGDGRVTTLQRAVFQLSIAELGKTASSANKEGSALPISSMLQIAYRNGSAVIQWTRTPNLNINYYAFYLKADGSLTSDGVAYSHGSRPAFTLPAITAVIANADGTYTLAA